MSVDRSETRPLHRQVADTLRRAILGHDLMPGSALPSESEMCVRYGVGRSVVRQAVAALADEGLVHRQQGRPSLVRPQAEYRRLVQRSTGLFEQFARHGHSLGTRILELGTDAPPEAAHEFLGTDQTWRLERVRLVDGEPLSYVRTWLPRDLVPTVDTDALTDASLHRYLTDEHGLRPRSGRRQVRAVAADELLADALGLAVAEPLLLLEGETRDQHGRPLEWFSTWHRADRVVFDVDVSESAEVLQVEVASGADAAPVREDLAARARALATELRDVLDRL